MDRGATVRVPWCGSAESVATRNQVAERDAELCVAEDGARTMVNDICAKPDSLGIVSGRENHEPTDHDSEGGHGGERWKFKLGVTTCV